MKTWNVSTLDTKAAISLDDRGLYLESLCLNGEERGLKTQISFPKYYRAYPKDYRDVQCKKKFCWEYYSDCNIPGGVQILFRDNTAGCSYWIKVTGRKDIAGPVEFSGSLTNTGNEGIRLIPEDIYSFGFAFEDAPTAWRFMKESGVAEGVKYGPEKEVMYPGIGIYCDIVENEIIAETNTHQDFNAGGHIPMIYFEREMQGAYVAVEWTSCRIKAVPMTGGIKVSIDLQEDFSTNLPKGGVLDVPPVYVGVYNGDIEDGSNIFKRWFFLEKTPKTFLENENEPLTQTDQQFDLNVDGLGIQSVKWDYGWWGDEKLPGCEGGILCYYEGSWMLRSPFYKDVLERCGCKTLADFGKKVREMGLNWTMYVLLHDSQKALYPGDELTSVGPTGHSEWFTGRRIFGLCPTADLGNEECVEYLKRKLYEFFTSNYIGTWRTDFEPIPFASDKVNRHDANGTDVQYWCSKGFFDIVDYLLENIPGFRYECCSSGGSLKDFATMRRTSVFNNDDSADYESLRTTFYDSSYCFPPSQLQWPLNPDTFCPDCEAHYKGYGNKDFGFRSVIMGAVMLGSWCGSEDNKTLKYNLLDYYKEYVNLHNEKIKHLVRHANLYHILPRPDGIHWDGMQYGMVEIPENRICGASFIFKPSDQDGTRKRIPVRGLNPDITYSAEFYEHKAQSFVATGRELMEKGFEIELTEVCDSDIVFFVAK
ncbi:MAG: alpha-galactosidase [Roseburia sp.]|nr:alpha-galactosidase [Roseburia sp.]